MTNFERITKNPQVLAETIRYNLACNISIDCRDASCTKCIEMWLMEDCENEN